MKTIFNVKVAGLPIAEVLTEVLIDDGEGPSYTIVAFSAEEFGNEPGFALVASSVIYTDGGSFVYGAEIGKDILTEIVKKDYEAGIAFYKTALAIAEEKAASAV